MKKGLVVLVLACLHSIACLSQWKVQPIPIQTRWTNLVSPTNALSEYPRPQMVRSLASLGMTKGWLNLNGLWDYRIDSGEWGKILVPFPIESALSGVKRIIQPNQILYYRRKFNLTAEGAEKTLLHFGGVDWQATVFINGKEVGVHTGGFDNFSFDISSYLREGTNEIVVKVYDPTDQGPNPHGKQVLNPKNIWYTPTTGIWQTVWLETVPDVYIEAVKLTPNIDSSKIHVEVKINGASNGYTIVTSLNDKKNGVEWNSTSFDIPIKKMKLWSPEDPYLYDLYVSLHWKGEETDFVKTYFGMRKVEIKKDHDGHDRIFLNNKYIFNLGVLDQGFWPDGIYTAPTDEALAFDIKAIKSMGFNTIRKHIKREPDRWYYWCDKLGMMVWQDMINPSFNLTDEAKKQFEKESEENIRELYNHPSITTYTLFNEKWGQYDQQRLTKWIKQLDPTRLVNGHSGEILYVNEKLRSPSPNAYIESDITDVHSYPDPMNSIRMNGKAQVLGEFGGIGVFIPDHQWNANNAWGYINVTPGQFKAKYTITSQHLKLLEKEGLSASIYTQPFDVEGEQNGLMTYDREVIKIPFKDLRTIHNILVPTASHLPNLTAESAKVTEPTQIYSQLIQKYLRGEKSELKRLFELAIQTGDAAGKQRFGNEYIATLKAPFSTDDIALIESSTKKITDPGFNILLQQLNGEKKLQRPVHVKLMNIIYQDVIASYVPNGQAKPNWDEVEQKIKLYGSPGEEIYLRAKTIHLMNQQDWSAFKPVAQQYLDKYGSYLKADEKKMLEDKIK